jgi:hypothetical protein
MNAIFYAVSLQYYDSSRYEHMVKREIDPDEIGEKEYFRKKYLDSIDFITRISEDRKTYQVELEMDERFKPRFTKSRFSFKKKKTSLEGPELSFLNFKTDLNLILTI